MFVFGKQAQITLKRYRIWGPRLVYKHPPNSRTKNLPYKSYWPSVADSSSGAELVCSGDLLFAVDLLFTVDC